MLYREKITSLVLVILVVALHSLPAKADGKLLKQMVHFDQAYIPTLAFTSEEKVKQSRNAMTFLLPVWDKFRTGYQDFNMKDPEWRTDFDRVDVYIKDAKKIIDSGKNLHNAHEKLESIRVVLMNLRTRNGIDYFIDYLTRYHEPMEKIVLAAKGKSAETFSENDLVVIRKDLPKAKNLWMQIESIKFDSNLFEFNANKKKLLQTLVNDERIALERLDNTLKQQDKNKIIMAAVGIKPSFARIFKLFGKFPELN